MLPQLPSYVTVGTTETRFLSEQQLQAACCEWFHNNPDFRAYRGLLFHVNNKARNRAEGNKFKAMGVTAGVSDLIWLMPNGHTALIELKYQDGTQSLVQRNFEINARLQGHNYYIVNSLAAFQRLVLALLDLAVRDKR